MSVKSIYMIVMTMLSALIPLVALPVLATLDTLEMEPFAVSLAGYWSIIESTNCQRVYSLQRRSDSSDEWH